MNEKNELIEEFWIEQGGKPHDPADIWFYESDWGMLMDVIMKIEKLGGYVGIETVEVYSYHPGILDLKLSVFSWSVRGKRVDTKISLTHMAIVEFIKWYNSRS